jgi:hypothetical protein
VSLSPSEPVRPVSAPVRPHIMPGTTAVTNAIVLLREGPGAGHIAVATIPRGTSVKILFTTEDGWKRVAVDLDPLHGHGVRRQVEGFVHEESLAAAEAAHYRPAR